MERKWNSAVEGFGKNLLFPGKKRPEAAGITLSTSFGLDHGYDI